MKPHRRLSVICSLTLLLLLLALLPPSTPASSTPETTVLAPPVLTPPYNGDCNSNAWYKVPTSIPGYLTLNVDNPGDSTNSAVWTPAIPATGTYIVQAYIPNPLPYPRECFNEGLTTDARYEINYAGGQGQVIVDQSAGTSWVNLGRYTFNLGNTGNIKLTDLNGEPNFTHSVMFSAIKFINMATLTEQVYLPLMARQTEAYVFVSQAWTDEAGGTPRIPFFPGETILFNASGTNLYPGPTPANFTLTMYGPCGNTTIFSGIITLNGPTWNLEMPRTAPTCTGLYAFEIKVEYTGFISSKTSAFAVTSSDQFFDKCTVELATSMQVWWEKSPYYHTNLYIGGSNRACSQPRLTPEWIDEVSAQGWGFIPTWVGPQAPCIARSVVKFSYTPSVAHEQGRDEADLAVAAMQNLGFPPGTPIYYDMEGFTSTYQCDTTCANAVYSFLDGWTQRLHELGYVSGAYGGSRSSCVRYWIDVDNPPDEVWLARWNTVRQYDASASAYSDPYVPDNLWNGHRLRQYAGDHGETWGGVRFTIDSNAKFGMEANPLMGLTALGPEASSSAQIIDAQLLPGGQGWAITRGRLLQTGDAGSSWTDITPVEASVGSLLAVNFLDPSTGWLAVEKDGLQVLRTIDGGASWTAAALPPLDSGGVVKSLGFSDAHSGWLEIQLPSSSNFSLGVLYRSFDGGVTWTEMALPAAGELTFTSEFNGWLAGGPGGDELYRTTDAGNTWERVLLMVLEPGLSKVSLPAFSDPLHGLAAVTVNEDDLPRVELFSTTDGGSKWVPSGTIPLDTHQDAPARLAPTGASRWITALPENGTLFASTGRAATAVSSGQLPAGIVELSFSGSMGWAVAYQGQCKGVKGTADFTCSAQSLLYQTRDGGSTWTQIELPELK